MRNPILLKFSLGVLFLLISLLSQAAPSNWQITPKDSKLTFTAVQNNAPVTGEFTSFSGIINFDPTALNSSSIRIVVDTTSINSSYDELTSTLKSADWFDTKKFPTASFQTLSFSKIANNTYQAQGNLTIRDKTQPVVLTFTWLENPDHTVQVTGTTTLKRTAFALGQGEWAKTDVIKDNVDVKFHLILEKTASAK